jgi:hypothetical protein
MMIDNNMGRFFDWLAKTMNNDDIIAWYLANNIIPERTELFRDFCMSFLNLLNETYLGEDEFTNIETKVGMSLEQKKQHFRWCWNKTMENFTKEEIYFVFTEDDSIFFENFFFDVFYSQSMSEHKKSVKTFFEQIFDYKYQKTKADIEIFTDLYKLLERSLNVDETYLQK